MAWASVWQHHKLKLPSPHHISPGALVHFTVSKALTNFYLTPHLEISIGSKMLVVHGKYSLPDELNHEAIIQRCNEQGAVLHVQRQLTEHIDGVMERKTRCPPATMPTTERKHLAARYNSTARRKTSITFATLPHPKYFHFVPPELWRTMITARLGGRHFQGKLPCPSCSQHAPLDDLGHHASSCLADQGGTRRHNLIRDTLFAALRGFPWMWSVKSEWFFLSESPLAEGKSTGSI